MSEPADSVEYIGETFPNAEFCGWAGPGWYFWDESEAFCHGPYTSEEEAQTQAEAYARDVLG